MDVPRVFAEGVDVRAYQRPADRRTQRDVKIRCQKRVLRFLEIGGLLGPVAGIERERTMEVWDLAWGEQNEVYWDDLMLSVWSSEPESGRFWELVKDQMHAVGETDASTGLPPLPDWASNYLGQMTDQERVNIAITLPDEAASKFLAQSGGVPSEYAEKRARAASLKADADRAVEDARRAAEARGDA